MPLFELLTPEQRPALERAVRDELLWPGSGGFDDFPLTPETKAKFKRIFDEERTRINWDEILPAEQTTLEDEIAAETEARFRDAHPLEMDVALDDLLLEELAASGPDPQEILQGTAAYPPDLQHEIDRCRIRRSQRLVQITADKIRDLEETLAAQPATEERLPTEPTPTISEEEAARLIGCSTRHLGNLRRAGAIPRSLYQQLRPNGRVRYYRERFEAWASNRKQDGPGRRRIL